VEHREFATCGGTWIAFERDDSSVKAHVTRDHPKDKEQLDVQPAVGEHLRFDEDRGDTENDCGERPNVRGCRDQALRRNDQRLARRADLVGGELHQARDYQQAPDPDDYAKDVQDNDPG